MRERPSPCNDRPHAICQQGSARVIGSRATEPYAGRFTPGGHCGRRGPGDGRVGGRSPSPERVPRPAAAPATEHGEAERAGGRE